MTQTPSDYFELAALVDRLLEISEDRVERLAELLDTLEEPLRMELLCSDFLNAFQSFYYFFRTIPSPLVEERLMLVPASDAVSGVLVEEIDLCQLVFVLRDHAPFILITDGERAIASFSGREAYREAVRYLEEHPC